MSATGLVMTVPETMAVLGGSAVNNDGTVDLLAVAQAVTDKATKGKKKAAKEEAPPGPLGLVLYTDGGCRPNPGPGGYGVHGYLFRDEPPKKGAGQPDNVLTQRGYVTKGKMATSEGRGLHEVAPVHYVDGFGAIGRNITNNIAEISASTRALQYALQVAELKTVLIRTDSQYVVKGLESWVDGWMRNGWVKQDGMAIANVEYWQELVKARNALRERGVKIQIEWVKGHDDILGNVQADKLATIGVLKAQRNELTHSMEETTAEGYWKYEADRHPFITHRYMYINTQRAFNRPGEYYTGNQGSDTELLGKRVSDGAYSLVRIATPDPLLELIRERELQIAGDVDTIALIRLEHIFRSEVHRFLTTHGNLAIVQPDPKWLHLEDLDEEPIAKELRPPRLAMRAVEAIEGLAAKLDLFEKQDPSITVTDLTPHLYETNVKVDKKGEETSSTKLKAQYGVGFASLEVDAAYSSGADVSSASIILTLGIDMLDRNALKRLEERSPKVSLITWPEAPDVFRYATVVQAGDDKGIWAGIYANLRVITPG